MIGDFIVDIYLQGTSTRLSPEAPVPVVDVVNEKYIAGGAANVACNLKALGADIIFCAVVGDDNVGAEAIRILKAAGISTDGVITCAERQTISKCRVLAGSQCITRIDKGSTQPLSAACENKLIKRIAEAFYSCDAVIISDYDKGTITPGVVEVLRELQGSHHKVIGLDSKRFSFFSELRVTVAKPNYDEAIKLLDISRNNEQRVQQIRDNAKELCSRINADYVAVTLDEFGSLVLNVDDVVSEVHASKITKPSVSGAGDTYLSTFVLAWSASRDVRMSAELASVAATIAVQKEFTACCSFNELRGQLQICHKLVEDHQELASLCKSLRAEGKRIVFTNGCFDILHSGHVTYLRSARELGDILIVGVNNDNSIRRLKGKSRPVNPLCDRVEVLAALSCVNYIVAFGSLQDDTPIPVLELVKPDFFAKGGDYTIDQLPEADTVIANGGQVAILPHVPDHSTTRIIHKINTQSLTKI